MLLAEGAHSQESEAPEGANSATAQEADETAEEPPETGDEDEGGSLEKIPEFGGPRSVTSRLNDDAERAELVLWPQFHRAKEPWFDAKERVLEKTGLSYGVIYKVTLAGVNESLGEDRAAGGMFQILGSWTAFGSDSGSSGTAVLKLESHHTLGTELTPDSLGFEAGAVSNTAAQFGGHGWALTNLYWQQRFSGNRLSVIVGQVDPADYVDTYGLGDPETTFQNQSFSTGPTIALPSPGLGLAMGGGLTENVYFVAGLGDANGTRPDSPSAPSSRRANTSSTWSWAGSRPSTVASSTTSI